MLVAGIVSATLDVAPKCFGFVGIGETKATVGLERCMWGCSGRLEKLVKG